MLNASSPESNSRSTSSLFHSCPCSNRTKRVAPRIRNSLELCYAVKERLCAHERLTWP